MKFWIEGNLQTQSSKINTFGLIKTVSDTKFGMTVTTYEDEPLIGSQAYDAAGFYMAFNRVIPQDSVGREMGNMRGKLEIWCKPINIEAFHLTLIGVHFSFSLIITMLIIFPSPSSSQN